MTNIIIAVLLAICIVVLLIDRIQTPGVIAAARETGSGVTWAHDRMGMTGVNLWFALWIGVACAIAYAAYEFDKPALMTLIVFGIVLEAGTIYENHKLGF